MLNLWILKYIKGKGLQKTIADLTKYEPLINAAQTTAEIADIESELQLRRHTSLIGQASKKVISFLLEVRKAEIEGTSMDLEHHYNRVLSENIFLDQIQRSEMTTNAIARYKAGERSYRLLTDFYMTHISYINTKTKYRMFTGEENFMPNANGEMVCVEHPQVYKIEDKFVHAKFYTFVDENKNDVDITHARMGDDYLFSARELTPGMVVKANRILVEQVEGEWFVSSPSVVKRIEDAISAIN
jgi:hypothetical protein